MSDNNTDPAQMTDMQVRERIVKLEVALKRLLDVTVWVDSGCKQLGAAEQAAREALREQKHTSSEGDFWSELEEELREQANE